MEENTIKLTLLNVSFFNDSGNKSYCGTLLCNTDEKLNSTESGVVKFRLCTNEKEDLSCYKSVEIKVFKSVFLTEKHLSDTTTVTGKELPLKGFLDIHDFKILKTNYK